ncbi:Cation-transporting P-type ATPase family and Cation-transporting P-type ATPase, subfamily V and P-type ATPase, A domain and HAD-like domain and P-type ATPase, cytoplasmic domain N-containing protein [Strongyloides ratti]|uniref:Cation-transporting P-type ATPase family and Cation-transporting P-type ATPase, subfamily V and P-type ATPase, A domain and HAD-like domain and P-type ATPase, cytoplasmic domain N-containing protein n=1 Tax=Strongyloides ratti TaxID=34506 RepID=A0A090L4U3_STRRB|nr:Cation-transporting P-type ATPase family and Cation-transporting P-type ATPase, subfamily V and P-type ATPase, A domain and HAD-like domain and P-type ATPase, cytoplasmic domain N-containing protein [Strongyloides ratti]CEF64712.1 Cation-transporting P-type ATPase family and Cation-transporting P-type ATPase, subfamily V and P-type ATPase, A domain and HAD-like domain and P-type ATPase, cytoplasmic domain N-containing protein [Strongyloides ratti]
MAVDELIEYIKICKKKPILLHLHVAPFIVIYLFILLSWNFYFQNEENYFTFIVLSSSIFLLQILLGLFSLWFKEFYYILAYKSEKNLKNATHALIKPTLNNGRSEIVPIKYDNLSNGVIKISIEFQKVVYIYDNNKKQFNQLEFDNNKPFSHFNSWLGLTSEEIITETKLKYGNNNMEMIVPSFMELFVDRTIAPFFVFQIFCVGLWFLSNMVIFSLFTLVMLVLLEMTVVFEQKKNMKMIRDMGNKPYFIDVYRNKEWKVIQSNELIVGDLILIGRSLNDDNVPCDLLLLRGNCILDETMLTGESIPQMKESIETLDKEKYFDYKRDMKLHVLCGGTKIIQHSYKHNNNDILPKPPNDGVLCYVLKTGFSTSQGSLLRTILFGVNKVTANNFEAFIFISFLLVFAIAAAIYVWITRSVEENFDRFQTFVKCSLIITSVVPTKLPIVLSLAVNQSLEALSKLGIFCTEPFRIPFCGKVDICCFDKTGTLTTDNLVVDGIGIIDENKNISIKNKNEISDITLNVLASCHSLIILDGDLVGDPIEKSSLNWIEWNIIENDLISSNDRNSQTIKILQRYHFTSQLRRMTVISEVTSINNKSNMIVTVKGAPEVLKNMLTSIPEGYVNGYKKLTQQGFRVLALGYSKLKNIDKNNLRHISRNEFEKDLTFAGFLVISCPLKDDSKIMIKEIKDSGHDVVMITGDNQLTACHVSNELKFTDELKEIMILGNENDKWYWQSVDEKKKVELKNESFEFFNQNELCVTGNGFDYLYKNEHNYLKSILKYIKIYSRMAPKQKEEVINELKNQGYITLMCGDGTNDVGALKHSHVGVALLSHPSDTSKTNNSIIEPVSVIPEFIKYFLSPDHPYNKRLEDEKKMMKELGLDKNSVIKLGDASIAAPFTSKFTSISSICTIIKQGRCTLVVTLQMFKILALNALISAYSQSVLYSLGIRASDYQMSLKGSLLSACYLFVTSSRPSNKLSKRKPMPNIFNIYTISTVFFQFLVHFACILYIVNLSNIYEPQIEKVTSETKFVPSLLNSSIYLLGMTLQISNFAVNYKGQPFMESIFENKPFLYSLILALSVIFIFASNLLPIMSNFFEVVQFPSDFKNKLIIILFGNITTCFIIDKTLNFFIGDNKLKKVVQ